MNIYVSNLSYSIKDNDLRELFEGYGEVSSARVITDRNTGRSRGFGFVEMTDDEAGQKAINELNAAEVQGRNINVNEARPQTERPERTGGYRDRNDRFERRNDNGPRRW